MRLHLRNLAHQIVTDNNDDPALIEKVIELVLKEKKGKISMDMVEKAYKEAKSS